jgi:CSLREA domain-containing protein
MKTHVRIVTLTVTVLFAAGAGQAAAATLTVTTFDDLSGPGDGHCSLREAIAAVDSPGTAGSDCKPAAFGANTIVIPAGTTTLASHFDPTTGGLGELVIAPTVTNLTIVGAGETKTTIATRSDFSDRLLRISPGATVAIKELTLTGGRAVVGDGGLAGTGNAAGAGANGGAILNDGSLTLIDSAVMKSRAGDGGLGGFGLGATTPPGGPGGVGGAGGPGGSGGGIYNTGALTLQGSTIAGNSAGSGGAGGRGGDGTTTGGTGGAGGAGGEGGGVANAGGTLTVMDSTFNGNSTGDGGPGGGGGGGAMAGPGGNGGSASDGGSIVSTGGTVSITNSTFASNEAGDGGSGGTGGAAPNPVDSPGAGGNGGGGGSGGAIDVVGVGSALLQSATIAGNSAGAGGAGAAGGFGAPAAASGTAGSAGTGGGIVTEGPTTTLQNSLLATNPGGSCSGPVLDSGHNLSFAGAGCPASFATSDPNLGPLQNNGGPAQTISLAPGSAAIDKVPATGAGCPATDERGVHRPFGSGCDIGAYEVAPPTATTGTAKSVTATGAIVTASITPNAGAAAVQFQFGTSKKYKSKTKVQHVGGVAAVTVTAKLVHLRPGRTYHYRVTIVASDGTSEGQDRTFKASNRPTLTGLVVKPAAFRASGPGATITYSDTVAATTTFTVLSCTKPLAHGARCAHFVKVGSFSHRDRAGHNKVPLRARIGVSTLSAGIYTLQARPRAGRKTGNTVAAGFQILA